MNSESSVFINTEKCTTVLLKSAHLNRNQLVYLKLT